MTNDRIPHDKALLRTQLSEARAEYAANLTVGERITASAKVARAALAEPLIASAVESGQTFASYLPLGSEPDTTALHDSLLRQGIRVLVPECVTDDVGEPKLAWIELEKVSSETDPVQLQRDQRGIPIPPGQRAGVGAQGLIDADCQVILVPALAATSGGQRLGKGAGYYDRLLAELAEFDSQGTELHSVAIVFAGELLDAIPTEPHDAKVTTVVVV